MRVVCLGPFVPRQLLGRAWLQPHAQYFWCTCRKSHISPFASGLPTAQPCSSAVRAARGASWPRVDLLKPCCHRCLYPGAPGSWAVSQRARHGEGSVYKEELNRFSGVPSHLYACGQASKKKKRKKSSADEVYQSCTSGNVSFWLDFVWVFSLFGAVSEQPLFVLLQREARGVEGAGGFVLLRC